jgi:hypothetical protein
MNYDLILHTYCTVCNVLTRIDMAYFMHLAVWPPKSSLTPNSKKLCDVTVECGGRVGA